MTTEQTPDGPTIAQLEALNNRANPKGYGVCPAPAHLRPDKWSMFWITFLPGSPFFGEPAASSWRYPMSYELVEDELRDLPDV